MWLSLVDGCCMQVAVATYIQEELPADSVLWLCAISANSAASLSVLYKEVSLIQRQLCVVGTAGSVLC